MEQIIEIKETFKVSVIECENCCAMFNVHKYIRKNGGNIQSHCINNNLVDVYCPFCGNLIKSIDVVYPKVKMIQRDFCVEMND